jgi:hypothetical protein
MKKLAMLAVFGLIAVSSVSCAAEKKSHSRKANKCKRCSSLVTPSYIENVS